MSIILGTLLLGITFLSVQIGAVPSEEETVISQLARTVYDGRNAPVSGDIGATTLILIMAANTAFADFPRLSALLAADGFLPRQLTYRGSRLVYSRGIVALALIASLLIIVFQASVTLLIPLYAIGVFLSFTLSQAGMARRWRKSGHLAPDEELVERGSTLQYDPGWRHKMVINGFGAVMTAVVDAGLRHHQVPRRRLDRPDPDPGARPDLLHDPSTLSPAGEGPVAGGVRRAAAYEPPPGDHAGRRRPPRLAGRAVLCQIALG